MMGACGCKLTLLLSWYQNVFCILYILNNKHVCRAKTEAPAPDSICAGFNITFSSVKVPCLPGCCSLTSPDAELHGAAENAFVTLNPCSVSVDDIIVWEHITSPLPRLSLLKTAPPYVYWAIHTCTHTDCLSVYKCDIPVDMHINDSMRLHFVRGLPSSYCENVNTIRATSNSTNVLKSYKLLIRWKNIDWILLSCVPQYTL